MDKYPRTHPGLWLTISFLFVFVSLPALAQNGSVRNNNQQAALHIRVNVVRSVSLPPVTYGHPHNDAVTYNVSTAKPDVEVKEEIRPLFGTALGQSGGSEGAVLKTLTVVVH